jgi:alkaline phosphatase D
MNINRRAFLFASASFAAAGIWSCGTPITRNPIFSQDPFQLGVASGDPDATSVVIWTHLAPEPLHGGGMNNDSVIVAWEVADNEHFTTIIRRGEALAQELSAHAVHVEVEGLNPDRWYFYRFLVGKYVSPVGKTRTMPALSVMPAAMRIGVASCQNFEQGLYTAHEHLAQENMDLICHVGDYIYEYAGRDKQVRKHIGGECMDVAGYRTRYAQYRSDAALRLAHASAPWVVTPDDHEFDNNCAGAISEELNVDPQAFLARRAAAYQVYFEHMPLRRFARPRGPDMQLYRRLHFGRLAQFDVLDTRQYRSDQPCGDGIKVPCPAALAASQSILGAEQKKWLFAGLSRSQAAWNVLVQQIMVARVDARKGAEQAFNMDQWPGYEMERRELLQFYHDRKTRNPVTVAGDIHSNWANDLVADFSDLNGKIVASEFVGTSISSGGNGIDQPAGAQDLRSENPFIKYYNAQRGYLRCTITEKAFHCDFRVVPFVDKPGAPVQTAAQFMVEAGRPGVQKV